MAKNIRRQTPTVRIGGISIGSDHPVAVQSMTDTPTADVEATLRQTLELVAAGSELVRWTINDDAAAKGAVEGIRRLRSQGVNTPIIGDFHFNGHLLLSRNEELAGLLDKYRINPGNVGNKDENFAAIVKIAIKHGKPIRIGVNWGSLDQGLLAGLMDENTRSPEPKGAKEVMYEAVLKSALDSCRYAMDLGLLKEKIVLSAKLSDVQDTVELYQRLSKGSDFVLHLGLTEAGGGIKGIAASAAALSILLQQGIGDTIRVSLTPEPESSRSREVEVCQEILQSMGFRFFSPSVVSCPGCGRTQSGYFRDLACEVRGHIASRIAEWKQKYPGVEQLKVAVMGCVVNGPGESRHADIGISLPGSMEEPVAPVYVDGQKVATLKGKRVMEEFMDLLEAYIVRRFRKES